MTSKERVKKTFEMEKTDRIPIDYFGNAGINGRLMKYFNIDYYGMLDALGVDFRAIYAPYKGKKLFPEKEGMIVNDVYGFYSKWIEHETGGYWDFAYFPIQGADDETIASFPVPDPDDFDYGDVLRQAEFFKDRALYAGSGGFADIINSTGRVMGMEQTLINIATEDEATLAYINRRSDMELKTLERTIEALGDKITFMWIGEDLGTQIAPMIGLDLYRRVLKPIHKRYVDLTKSYDLPVMVHTCGSSSWAYEDFIELGVRAVDTLQPEAANMSPEYLLDKFGGRLCFHGCISTAGPLAYGTADETERDVMEKCTVFKPSRSYMMSPTHSIQDNSPTENVLRMYESAKKYGKY